MRNPQTRLREALSIVTKKKPVYLFPKAFRNVVWELMRLQTRVKKLEEKKK